MNFVLNDSTPTPTPTNGCCAGQTDGTSPGKPSMKLGGSAGTGSTSVSVINRNEFTYLYLVGTPGDLSGQAINAGTWTVELYVTSLTGTCIVDSVFICQATGGGSSLGTLASSTPNTVLASNLNTFTLTQAGSSPTFGSTDVVIISFQIHGNPSGSFTISHGQNGESITAPGPTVAGGVPPPQVVRSDFVEPGLIYVARPSAPHPIAGKPPSPYVLRSDSSQEAILWVGKPATVVNPVPIAGPVVQPRVISFPQGFPTGSPDKPFAGVTWQPTTLPVAPYGTPGIRILFNRGPEDHIPIHQMGEPAWTTDTFQMFVGDSFANHFIGGEPVSVPSSSSSPGYPNQWSWDGTYLYICVSNGLWMRAAMSSF